MDNSNIPKNFQITSLPPGTFQLPASEDGASDRKIQITWDEIHSRDVDARMQQQDALARTQQHVQQTLMGSPLPERSEPKTGFWKNSLVYMPLFGLIGGLCAWLAGEFAFSAFSTHFSRAQEFDVQLAQIFRRENRGEITPETTRLEVDRLCGKFRDNPYVQVLLELDLTDAQRADRRLVLFAADQPKENFRNALFYMFVGAILAYFLSVAESVAGRNLRGVLVNGAVGAIFGLLGGLLVSLFIDRIFLWIQGNDVENLGRLIIARTTTWGMIGLFLATAPGIVLRNFKKLAIGAAGGLLGGLIAGLLFDPIEMATQNVMLSRAVSITAIGVLAGLGTGVIENVVKSAWLKVVSGLIAGKQFVLYRNPTTIGSSPTCDLYLFKDPHVGPRHALIHSVSGAFELEDLGTTFGTYVNGQACRRCQLSSGDQIQIGSTVLVFQEKARAVR